MLATALLRFRRSGLETALFGVVTSDGGLILFGGEKAVRHWLHSIILIMDGQFFS